MLSSLKQHTPAISWSSLSGLVERPCRSWWNYTLNHQFVKYTYECMFKSHLPYSLRYCIICTYIYIFKQYFIITTFVKTTPDSRRHQISINVVTTIVMNLFLCFSHLSSGGAGPNLRTECTKRLGDTQWLDPFPCVDTAYRHIDMRIIYK
jgi:hypothetical protein